MSKEVFNIDSKKYPILDRFAHEIGVGRTVTVNGRDKEIAQLRSYLNRPVVSNALLLGGAGTGKTAMVEHYAAAYSPANEHVIELDVVNMAENGRDQFNAFLKRSMDEVIQIQKENNINFAIFVDEFHVVAMNGGTDAIKPILARSGQTGIRFIAATTDEEYFEYIKPNQALDQRLQPIKLSEPSDEEMLPILRSTVQYYAPDMNELFTDAILKRVILYGKYQPAMFQPRKSILFIDALIGDYRALGIEPSIARLNELLEITTGIKANWRTDIDKVVKHVKRRVKGQDAAINIMKDSLNVSVAGINDPGKPMGSFLFSGTTGVGKTELTRALAEAIFGSERAMLRFDMSEYQTQDSVSIFQERVTIGLTKRPYVILLFDELEKAHVGIRNLLLQLLDDGRLSDKYGRQVSGLNAYIIMTTNLGAGTLNYVANNDSDVRQYQPLLFADLSVDLSPEFLGRLSAIVPFQPLSNHILIQIAQLRITELSKRIRAKYGIPISLSGEKYTIPDGYSMDSFSTNKVLGYIVVDHVVKNANNGGGRSVARRIESEIASSVATWLNTHPKAYKTYSEIRLSVEGKMVLDDKFDSEGTAHIKIEPILRKEGGSIK